jgi:hypothetical protein
MTVTALSESAELRSVAESSPQYDGPWRVELGKVGARVSVVDDDNGYQLGYQSPDCLTMPIGTPDANRFEARRGTDLWPVSPAPRACPERRRS